MRLLIVCCLLLVGLLFVACGDEPTVEPQQVSEPAALQQAREADAPDAARTDEPDEAAEVQAEPVAAAEASETSQEAVESEAQAAAAVQAEPEDGKSEAAAPEQEEPVQGLTDVPATVVREADVRIRPGLAWRVTDRLELGAAVVALHQAGGWVRIRYGDGLAGWIRVTALDLGEVEEDQILEQAAPPLVAEWRGEEYGVMGQSADGAEVRLLQMVDERPTVVGAPIDEVRLIDADVTLEELPILVADETVVFPGDDFRVGQGKILPRANEWMWLPWGWLLAHNDTHIWQWRPETDELEFIERPPGFARLSPDGRYLAIENLCSILIDQCDHEPYVIILPLDGSEPVSAMAELYRLGLDRRSVIRSVWLLGMQWSADSQAVGIYVDVWVEQGGGESVLVVHISGRLVLFDQSGDRVIGELKCGIPIGFPGGSDNPWSIDGDTIWADGGCMNEAGERQSGDLMFSFDGEFLGVRDFSDWWTPGLDAELIRSAEGGNALSDHLRISWSHDENVALVVDLVEANAWVYNSSLHILYQVQFERDVPLPMGLLQGPDHDDEQRTFHLHANWRSGQVAAVVAQHSAIRTVWLIDATAGTGAVLDIGGLAFHHYYNPNPKRGWSQNGTVYYIISQPSVRTDGLAIETPRVHSLLTSDPGARLTNALNVASTCGESAVSSELRNRADWSPDGTWFAVGGAMLDGQRSCPD